MTWKTPKIVEVPVERPVESAHAVRLQKTLAIQPTIVAVAPGFALQLLGIQGSRVPIPWPSAPALW
jgi:hypothetical protein